MNKEYLIDTNVFLRFLVKDSSQQQQDCLKFLQSLEKGQIKAVTCSVVVMEIYFTLKSFYEYSTRKCLNFIKKILRMPHLKFIDDFAYLEALDLCEKTGIKFTDCLIASLKFFKNNGLIVSYDKDFDKLAVKRIEPGEI